MTAIDSIVARLTALHPKLIDLTLDRMWRILAALGHPERKLPPVIHVAGTNGKGSTIAFLRAILEAAGLAVHVYTSPHLVRFNERFRLGAPREGRLVDDRELADVLAECERVNGGAPITVFEITTAAGLLLFSRHPADMLLLEVGMGGRLDATNVIDRPLATVITPVSFDHAEHLGDTLSKIATEKAGILKRGVPAIVASQPRNRSTRLNVRPRASRRRSALPAKTGSRPRNAGGWSIRTTMACSICRRPSCLAATSSRMPASPSPHCGRSRTSSCRPTRSRTASRRAEWPARMQRLSQGRLRHPPAARKRAVAGRRPQRGWRTHDLQCACRPGGTGVASARARGRHALDQGQCGVS